MHCLMFVNSRNNTLTDVLKDDIVRIYQKRRLYNYTKPKYRATNILNLIKFD